MLLGRKLTKLVKTVERRFYDNLVLSNSTMLELHTEQFQLIGHHQESDILKKM